MRSILDPRSGQTCPFSSDDANDAPEPGLNNEDEDDDHGNDYDPDDGYQA